MEIKITLDGPWIVAMYDEVGKLCKEDADALWGWMLSWANTSQYPEDDEND